MDGKTSKLNMSHYLLGVRFDNWLRLRRKSRGKIETDRRTQAALITTVSLLLYPFAMLEKALFDGQIEKTEIKKDPVFILGHWRSGTTYLQNMLSRDGQFGWADPVRTAMFSNYILLGWLLRGGVKHGLKGARPMDAVEYRLDLPMEETFCLAGFTPYCLDHLLSFPDRWEEFIPMAFVEELPREERAKFLRAYDYVVKKLTMTGGGKQLLLKSPDNTARVEALLELYPDARFVNICRDPYATVRSAVKMIWTQTELNRLTAIPGDDPEGLIEDMVIDRMFVPMYERLFELEGSFRPHRFITVRYEDFVRQSAEELRKVYEALELDGYEEALPQFQAFAGSQKTYKTNPPTIRPELREKINAKLGFYFEHYGYEMREE